MTTPDFPQCRCMLRHGESFLKATGSSVDEEGWVDCLDMGMELGNVCVKAFATERPVDPEEPEDPEEPTEPEDPRAPRNLSLLRIRKLPTRPMIPKRPLRSTARLACRCRCGRFPHVPRANERPAGERSRHVSLRCNAQRGCMRRRCRSPASLTPKRCFAHGNKACNGEALCGKNDHM